MAFITEMADLIGYYLEELSLFLSNSFVGFFILIALVSCIIIIIYLFFMIQEKLKHAYD